MVDMMKDVVRRGSAASIWASGFKIPAAGKTGTTNDYSDVWFIGYTPDLVAGVWMGFDRPQKIVSNAQGGRLAAPAWLAFMNEAYQRRPTPPDWPRPEMIIARNVDWPTGLLAGPGCADSTAVTEYFIPGTEPVRECDSLSSPFAIPGAVGAQPGSTSTHPGADHASPMQVKRDTGRAVPNPFRIP